MKISAQCTPTLIVADHFYEDPDAVRAFALAQDFRENIKYHKGKRTGNRFLFPGIKEKIQALMGMEITTWEGYGVNGCFQICVAGDPVVYHYDTQQYAGVVYLTPDAPLDTGTQLLRSKGTGEMKQTRSEDYGKIFPRGHLDGTQFDVVDTVGNRYNRLVIWDAQNFHCAQAYFGTSLENGRLFQLFFFDVQKST
jgi:hypothetical protein